MAEFVEQRMEEMMNEVEQMERVNLLQVKSFQIKVGNCKNADHPLSCQFWMC